MEDYFGSLMKDYFKDDGSLVVDSYLVKFSSRWRIVEKSIKMVTKFEIARYKIWNLKKLCRMKKMKSWHRMKKIVPNFKDFSSAYLVKLSYKYQDISFSKAFQNVECESLGEKLFERVQREFSMKESREREHLHVSS